MSIVKAVLDPVNEKSEEASSVQNDEIVQCCDRHVLVNSRIPVVNPEGISYLNFPDFHAGLVVQQLRGVIREKDSLITGLERENMFLKEQMRSLNVLLDQLSISTRNLATKNDIRIKVENSSNMTLKRWYRKPRVIFSGTAVAVLFSIYLRYKIKHW